MLRGALHIAVVFSFLWLPLNRRHNIVLVYPIDDVDLWAEGVNVPSAVVHVGWPRDVQRKAVELGMNATYRSSRSKFASSMIGRPPLPELTSHVVVPDHIFKSASTWRDELLLEALERGIPIVKDSWISASHEMGVWLPSIFFLAGPRLFYLPVPPSIFYLAGLLLAADPDGRLALDLAATTPLPPPVFSSAADAAEFTARSGIKADWVRPEAEDLA